MVFLLLGEGSLFTVATSPRSKNDFLFTPLKVLLPEGAAVLGG